MLTDNDDGFTLIELAVGMMLGMIVLTLAATYLISTERAQTTTSDTISNQIAITRALRTIDHAVSDATTLTSATPLAVAWTNVDGSSQSAVYDPSAGTLVLNNLSSAGTVQGYQTLLTGIPTSSAIYSYYDQYGASLSGATSSTTTACSTRISISIPTGPSSQSTSVALANRISAICTQGDGTC